MTARLVFGPGMLQLGLEGPPIGVGLPGSTVVGEVVGPVFVLGGQFSYDRKGVVGEVVGPVFVLGGAISVLHEGGRRG